MIPENYSQPRKCDCYHSSTDYLRCKKYTYASCLEYLSRNGLDVIMPSHADTPFNIGDSATNVILDVTDNASQPEHIVEDGLFENCLLRYRELWGKSEADVFINGNIYSGVPFIADKNTLCVYNSSHSYSIPIEKIECIRTADKLL